MVTETTRPIWAVTPERMQEAVRRIVEGAHPLKIIVFGSQGRGDARADSDLDLMVIVDAASDRAAESVRLNRLLRELMMGVDILVVSRDKFEYWRDTPGNVYYEADQDGRVVYEAS